MWCIREWASPPLAPPHTYLLLRRGNKKQWIALLSNFSFHRSTFHKHCWPCNCLLHFLAGGRGRCMPWHTCRGQRTSSGVSSLNPPHGPQPWGQASLSTETSRQPTCVSCNFLLCVLSLVPTIPYARQTQLKQAPGVEVSLCVSSSFVSKFSGSTDRNGLELGKWWSQSGWTCQSSMAQPPKEECLLSRRYTWHLFLGAKWNLKGWLGFEIQTTLKNVNGIEH